MSSLGVIVRWRYSANQKGSNGESCHPSPITFKTRSLAFSADDSAVEVELIEREQQVLEQHQAGYIISISSSRLN